MSDKKITPIMLLSKKILSEYDLCDYCLGRMFAKKLNLKSYSSLGKKIHKKLKIQNKKSPICKNVFEALPFYVEKMLNVSSEYQYNSFLIGAKIKPSFLDRDDQIRSQFKLKGIDGVKTNITKELTKLFTRKIKCSQNIREPDIILTCDFKTESCEINSKSVYLSGRYTKTIRGISQKQKPCSNCLGKGCITCGKHGMTEFDSVEGLMSKYFFEKFGALQAKITWIGGEDSTSLVMGKGRPFFARLVNPKKRQLLLPKNIDLGNIKIYGLKQIPKIPFGPVQFQSSVKLDIETENPITQDSIVKLDELVDRTIAVYEKSGKRSEKKIYSVKYEVTSPNSFTVEMKIDGGIPLKHFVNGENVFPNVSDLISNKCTLAQFDFEQILTH